MGRAALAIASFFRLAFWPLSAAILVVLLLQPVYLVSLVALKFIAPPDRIAGHVKAGFEQGVLSPDGAPKPLIWRGGEQLTECLSLGVGLNPAETAWQAAIVESYPTIENTHACEGLRRAVTGAPVNWQPYFRYWHGYRVVIAPLTALFPLWLLKMINVLAVAGGCVLLWRALRSRCGEAVATIFLLTFLCLSDVLFVWRTTTHSLSLAYILAGESLVAAALRRNWTPASLIVLSAALGSGFNFIDFLVNPPLMPMLIAFFVLLSERRDAGLLAFAAVLAWFGGYAETWLAKWAIAYLSAANPAAVVSDVIGTIEIRTVGAFNGVYLFPLAATLRAFLRAASRVGVIVPALIALALARHAAAGSPIAWRRALWLWTPALVAVLWFEALSSHTQYHLTVSARSAAAALAMMLAAIVIAMPRRPSIRELWGELDSLRAKIPLLVKSSKS
jgi:hypothetical protein